MHTARSEVINPQDYYLDDGQGNFVDPNQDIADYAPNKALRKKVFDGNADIVLQSDRIQIYWKGSLVAEGQLVAQLSDTGGVSWDYSYDFNFLDSSINKITEIDSIDDEGNPIQIPVTPFYRAFELKDFPAIGVTDAVMGMDQYWAFKNSKQIFYLDVPGWLVRIRWQVRVKDSALRYLNETDPDNPVWVRGLGYSVKDYQGEVNHGSQADPEEGWTQHWWTFEPDGYQCPDADARTPQERFEDRAGLHIDPYLWIDEQASDVYIYADGWVLRLQTADTSSNVLGYIYDKAVSTDLCQLRSTMQVSSVDYLVSSVANTYQVIENTPTRVCIRYSGNYHDSSETVLANSVKFEYYFYVEPDRIKVDFIWTLDGTVNLDNSSRSSYMLLVDGVQADLTAEDNIHESTGSEADPGTYTTSDGDYVGFTSDEINIIGIVSYDSDAADEEQFVADNGEFGHGWVDASLGSGVHAKSLVIIIDSVEREGSAKIYDSTDRLAMGDQYKDPILDQSPSKGDDVTDMTLPARVSSGTLHSDGAHYYEPDVNDELKIAFDRTRIRPSVVIRDWPFQTGAVASPTDHLLCHLKCDDQAASSTVNDETANNADGTWRNTSDQQERNTNTSGDSVQEIGRGRNLYTNNRAAYIDMAHGSGEVHDNAFFKKGSILIKTKPDFAYNSGPEWLFYLRYDANNLNVLHWNASVQGWRSSIKWGTATDYYMDGPSVSSDYETKRQWNVLVSWDSDQDFLIFTIDGEVVDFKIQTSTPTVNEPAYFIIGSDHDHSDGGNFYLDQIKTFDVCILPFGAFFIGNGEGLLADIDNPHADLSWYFDGQAALAKGGTDLGSDKNPTNSGGQFTTTSPILGTNHWDSNGASNVLTVAEVGEDIVDYNKGFVAGWFRVESAAGGEYLIDCRADANNRISAVLDASNNIDVTYLSQGTSETITGDIAITDGIWFFLKITWDDTDKVHCYINGMENGTPQDIASTWGGGTGHTWYFTEDYNAVNGVDAFIGMLVMGKKANTPEIWTAFGKPLHIPEIFLQ